MKDYSILFNALFELRFHAANVLDCGKDKEERFTHYKSLIREEFARKQSVFFVLPTIEDIRRMKSQLE